MKPIFCFTIFVGSFLLFIIQPIVGKILLPSLGGTPAVWNTCLVFFQGLLLLGYGYSHFVSGKLAIISQVRLHLLLLMFVSVSLPIQTTGMLAAPDSGHPTLWLLLQLVTMVGLPFFVISSNAPLLQRWYSIAEGKLNSDPYFLYAFSNAGSLLALVAYPLFFERHFGLWAQTQLWTCGFMLLLVGFLGCALTIWKSPGDIKLAVDETKAPTNSGIRNGMAWRERLMIVALAAVPSSLMMGVTTCVTTDAGSVPLLWVIPLALYLITFIVAFSKRQIISHHWVVRIMPYVALMMAILLLVDLGSLAWKIVPVHFATFFVVAMMCHGEVARRRPRAEHLTEFYLLMSVGGVVGGFFNAIIAPQLFNGILEYPLALVAACLLRPGNSEVVNAVGAAGVTRWSAKQWLAELAIPACVTAYIFGVGFLLRSLNGEQRTLEVLGLFALPALVCFRVANHRLRFAGAYAAIVFGCSFFMFDQKVIESDRGFFGVTKIAVDYDLGLRMMINNKTVHGIQRLNGDTTEPLSYYHRTGPIGDVFKIMNESKPNLHVGVIGLGTGSIASYSKPNSKFDFYEIDPIVTAFATDTKHFSFLAEAAGECQIIMGDARLKLAEKSDKQLAQVKFSTRQVAYKKFTKSTCYDMLVLDAFSSDAIPTHLITREAIKLYQGAVGDSGLLVFHISNNFIDLEPLVAATAESEGIQALIRVDVAKPNETKTTGKSSSMYVVLSRNANLVSQFSATSDWRPLKKQPGIKAWTDDYSSMFDIIRWRE